MNFVNSLSEFQIKIKEVMNMKKSFVEGSTLLGVALSLFGIGTIVPLLWQKLIMFGCCFVYLTFSIKGFSE